MASVILRIFNCGVTQKRSQRERPSLRSFFIPDSHSHKFIFSLSFFFLFACLSMFCELFNDLSGEMIHLGSVGFVWEVQDTFLGRHFPCWKIGLRLYSSLSGPFALPLNIQRSAIKRFEWNSNRHLLRSYCHLFADAGWLIKFFFLRIKRKVKSPLINKIFLDELYNSVDPLTICKFVDLSVKTSLKWFSRCRLVGTCKHWKYMGRQALKKNSINMGGL